MKKDSRDIALAALDSHITHLKNVLELTDEGLTAAQHGRLRESAKRLAKLLDWQPKPYAPQGLATVKATALNLHPSHKWEQTPDPLLIGRAKSYGKVVTLDQLAQCANCMIQSFEPGADSECACADG